MGRLAFLIDLHLHTDASDGTLSPTALVARICRAGIETFSVTDHDTMAGVGDAAAQARIDGLEFLPGIEITAVADGKDVHVLGYFLDPAPPGLEPFLVVQRQDRVSRVKKMAALLAERHVPIDLDRLVEGGRIRGRALARPLVAAALVEAGHVRSAQEAFDRWIGNGRPAYVPRQGAPPAEIVRLITGCGGVASLAHPGLLGRDELIPGLVAAGLGAIEAYHSEHDTGAVTRYVRLARAHGLVATGGSDYHGEEHRRAAQLGRVGPPRAEFERLVERIKEHQGASRIED